VEILQRGMADPDCVSIDKSSHVNLAAAAIPTGKGRAEADKVRLAEELLALAKEKGVKFLLAVDDIETDELKAGAQSRNTRACLG
jgi:hypothetical protein